MRRLNAQASSFDQEFAALVNARREADHDVADAVAAIVAQVRKRGDAAVIDYSRRFDGVELTPECLRVSAAEIAAAESSCAEDVQQALRFAAARIDAYHRRQVPADASFTDESGVTLGWRWSALDSVGLYVPGGTASYPSSVLMNAIPAGVAGVGRIVMVTPASRGSIPPLTLVAAKIAGVSEITAWAARRRLQRWPSERQQFRPWTRLSAQETLMSQPPSVWCSAASESIPWLDHPKFWSLPIMETIRRGSRRIFCRRPNMIHLHNRS